MWFSAGIIPQFENYMATKDIFADIGITDLKWTVVLAMGMNATNIILLRKRFRGRAFRNRGSGENRRRNRIADTYQSVYSYEQGDDRNRCSLLRNFALERLLTGLQGLAERTPPLAHSVQVYIRDYIGKFTEISRGGPDAKARRRSYRKLVGFARLCGNLRSLFNGRLCCYPHTLRFILSFRKYFAKGVNMGGVKE